ncbi:unnamed protein product, partial [Rotaria sp. Silwood1]
MLKQINLEKLFGTTSLISDVENVQGKNILSVQLCLSHNEDNNKTSNVEKEILINETETEMVVDFSDEDE